MSEHEKDGRFMRWLIDKGIVSETDGSENPGEWRAFEQEDWQAKKEQEALDELTADKPQEENSTKEL